MVKVIPRATNRCFSLLILAIISAGIISFTLSFTTFQSAKFFLDGLANDGNSNLPIDVFSRIMDVLKWVGATCFVIGVILWIKKQKTLPALYDVIIAMHRSYREAVDLFLSEIKKEKKIHLFFLSTIIVAGVGIRIFYIAKIGMRYDEAFTFLVYASQPLHYIISNYSFPNNHILHTILVSIVYKLFGNEPWILRLPALFAGILMIPASYLAVRSIYNKYAALIAVVFVATSSPLIEYSTNARGYTLICLMFLLIFFLGKILTQNRNLFLWSLFILASTVGFYSIPIMMYPLGITITWMLMEIIKNYKGCYRIVLVKDVIIGSVLIIFLTTILYTPIFVVSGLSSVVSNSFVKTQTIPIVIASIPSISKSIWEQWNIDIPAIIMFILIFGILISVVNHKKTSSIKIPIIMAVFIFIILFLLIQRTIPPRRVWLFLLPMYFGMASAGVIWTIDFMLKLLKQDQYKSIYYGISIFLAIFLCWNCISTKSLEASSDTGIFRDAERITLYLRKNLRAGDSIIVYCPANYPLMYYFDRYHIKSDFFERSIDSANRIIVIDDENRNRMNYIFQHQNIKEQFKRIGFLDSYAIKEFKSSKIYQFNK